MFQRLPIAVTQVKAGNTFENLLNEYRQSMNSLYQAKEISKKVYNNMMNSIKLRHRMYTIFMNIENSKTSEPYRLLLSISHKKNLEEINILSDNYIKM